MQGERGQAQRLRREHDLRARAPSRTRAAEGLLNRSSFFLKEAVKFPEQAQRTFLQLANHLSPKSSAGSGSTRVAEEQKKVAGRGGQGDNDAWRRKEIEMIRG